MNRHVLIVLSLFAGAFIFSSGILCRVEPGFEADGLGDDVVRRLSAFLFYFNIVEGYRIQLESAQIVASYLIQLYSARDEPRRERVGGLDLRGLDMIEDQLRSISRRPQRRCSVASAERAGGMARQG